MNQSTQTVPEPFELDPVYGLRDDFARNFNPTNGYERILMTSAAQAWLRYQDAQKLERRLFEQTDPLELLTNQPNTFKTIARHVATAERAWRNALEEIRRAIRNRPKTLSTGRPRREPSEPMHPVQFEPGPTPESPGPEAAGAPCPPDGT